MQAHKGMGGFPLKTRFCKNKTKFSRKAEIFEKKKFQSQRKIEKKPKPIHYHNKFIKQEEYI